MEPKDPKQSETIERIRFWMVWHENGTGTSGAPWMKHRGWRRQIREVSSLS